MARTRITLAEGIYQDAHGITVIARIGSRPNLLQATARFPLDDDDGIPYSKKNNGELIRCRLQLLEDLRTKRAQNGGEAGSLGAAIDAFDPAPRLAYLYQAWRRLPIAALPVTAVTRTLIRAQLEAWAAAGLSPTSVNDRKRALAEVLLQTLYADADDPDEIVLPTDKIPNIPPRRHEPRGIPLPIIARILASLPDRGRPVKGETRGTVSHTKIRLTVMAWTGLPNISLARLQRRHVNFRESKIWLPSRHKGTGAAGVWVEVLPPAVAALRDYDAAGLWGRTFSNSSMHRTWGRAIVRTRTRLIAEAEASGDRTLVEQFLESVPANCHPYDLRHSYLTDAYRQSGDIRAVQHLAQHADLKTTEQYTKAAVSERAALAVEKMRARWFPEAPKPGATVRDFHVVEKG